MMPVAIHLDTTHTMTSDLDDEWAQFLGAIGQPNSTPVKQPNSTPIGRPFVEQPVATPLGGPLMISTKTKIVYLTCTIIPIIDVFWGIRILPYKTEDNGVLKKQIKFVCNDTAELAALQDRLSRVSEYTETILISQVDSARSGFKDIRKISIGLCSKDFKTGPQKRSKSAFYNCVVLIVRVCIAGIFREFHVKIFNTGKIEIPGIQSEDEFVTIIGHVLDVLRPLLDTDGGGVDYRPETAQTVLINSNFDVGYYIKREALAALLLQQYGLRCQYDPCSYPGVQCKYRMGDRELSVLMFRTGSVLIIGMCEDEAIQTVYKTFKEIFETHYAVLSETRVQSAQGKPVKGPHAKGTKGAKSAGIVEPMSNQIVVLGTRVPGRRVNTGKV
jgi:TATA-box binding protein (TBP) (component of TFIID and TFIIIB)